MCLYNYFVDQQYFDGDAKQNVTISANVEITCHSGNLTVEAIESTVLV